MHRKTRWITLLAAGLLAACQDPLARAGIYPGLAEVSRPQGPLVPVLFSAEQTPAYQGYLYTAMYDAEVAAQSAGLALVADRLEEVKTRVGEVVYAIDPEAAPAWLAKTTGIVELWAGTGYGLRRSLANMIEELGEAVDGDAGIPGLDEYGPRAARCAENTLDRADRTLALAQRILAADADADLEPLLLRLEEVAVALNRGVASPGDQGCGLEQAERFLDAVTPDAEIG